MPQTVLQTFTANRMSKWNSPFWVALDEFGGTFDLTGYSFHMWFGLPDLLEPAQIKMVQYNPASGFTVTPAHIQFSITEADLLALPAGSGTIPFEILATNDGGVTTIKPFAGTMVVPSFLTLTY